MVRIRIILILSAVVLWVTSCGPEQSTRDKETEQLQENFARQKSIMDSLNGEYVGRLKGTDGTGADYQVRMVLITFVEMVPAPNRVDFTQIPNLIGNLVPVNDAGNPVSWDITKGYVDGSRNAMVLTGSKNQVSFFIDLNIVGNKLKGRLVSGRFNATIDLTRSNK